MESPWWRILSATSSFLKRWRTASWDDRVMVGCSKPQRTLVWTHLGGRKTFGTCASDCLRHTKQGWQWTSIPYGPPAVLPARFSPLAKLKRLLLECEISFFSFLKKHLLRTLLDSSPSLLRLPHSLPFPKQMTLMKSYLKVTSALSSLFSRPTSTSYASM